MKTPHRSMKLLALAIALGMLAAIWSVWGASLAEALNFVKTTGQFGLARGQTARINVLNTGEVRGFVVNWKFLDARGNTIVESRKPVTILPGQAASFDLAFDIFFPTEVIRVELQAMVATVIGPDVKRSLVSTLEV